MRGLRCLFESLLSWVPSFFNFFLHIFLLCPICISCHFFSFCSHDLNSFGNAFHHPLGVAVPDEALRVWLVGVHLQPLLCVEAASGYVLLCFGPLHVWWTLLIELISLLEFRAQRGSLFWSKPHTVATCDEMALFG